jgi:hypothetical protein
MALFSLHYKFQIPSASVSLVIIRLEAKYKVHTAINLLFYGPQEREGASERARPEQEFNIFLTSINIHLFR